MPVETRSQAKRKKVEGSSSVQGERFVTPAPNTPKTPIPPNAPKKGGRCTRLAIGNTDSFSFLPNCPPLIENDEDEQEDEITLPSRVLTFLRDGNIMGNSKDNEDANPELESPFHSPREHMVHRTLGVRSPLARHDSFITPDGQVHQPLCVLK